MKKVYSRIESITGNVIAVRAQDVRYGELADQMEMHDTPDAAHFFRFMAGNEQKHRDELAALPDGL